MGLRAVSIVERFIIQCPYFGGSTIGGSTVLCLLLFFLYKFLQQYAWMTKNSKANNRVCTPR